MQRYEYRTGYLYRAVRTVRRTSRYVTFLPPSGFKLMIPRAFSDGNAKKKPRSHRHQHCSLTLDVIQCDCFSSSYDLEVRCNMKKVFLLPLLFGSATSFAPTRPSLWTPSKLASTTTDATFTSDGAKSQIGNNSFLNEDLMSRAQKGPGKKNKEKLKIGIVGAGLAGMVAAMDLADAGHDIEMFEVRPYVGGKVSSWKDKDGNHIEMGLHVFFGCYYNLFGIMKRTGSFDTALRIKEHTHTFVNSGGRLGALDFRFPIGAPVSGLQAFARTEQLDLADKADNALRLAISPIVRALVDFDGGMDMVRMVYCFGRKARKSRSDVGCHCLRSRLFGL